MEFWYRLLVLPIVGNLYQVLRISFFVAAAICLEMLFEHGTQAAISRLPAIAIIAVISGVVISWAVWLYAVWRIARTRRETISQFIASADYRDVFDAER